MDDAVKDAFRVRDAYEQGYSEHEVNRVLARPFWGIRAEQIDFSVPVRCRQLQPRIPAGAFYSHSTAAALWGLTLPPWIEADTRLHVSVPAGHRAVLAKHLIGHEVTTTPLDVTALAGLPVSTPARVWREMAPLLGLADLVALGDELLARARPLCTASELSAAAVRARGYRGRRNAVAAFPLLSDRAESRPESLMRVALVMAGLPDMLVNEDVTTSDRQFIARPDIRFREYPVVVEYEGDGHRTDQRQWRRDVGRLSDLAEAGLDVIRATADDLPYFRRLVVRVRSRLRRHGWSTRTASF